MTDLILAKLKEMVILQDIVKKHDINYKSKRGKTYNFGKYSLRDGYTWRILIIRKCWF